MVNEIFREYKRSLIVGSRDFCCPISDRVLDLQRSHLFKIGDGKRTQELLIDRAGINELKKKCETMNLTCDEITAETFCDGVKSGATA